MKLINVGFGNMVSAERVISVVSPESAPIKRLVIEAKEEKRAVDVTCGRKTRCVLICDSGHVILSSLTAETVAGRIHDESNENGDSGE